MKSRSGGESGRPALGAGLPTPPEPLTELFYLEGRSYEEIGTELHIPVNSIGPILSRARHKLRKGSKNPPVK